MVRAQCSNSTLVSKVKVLERAFENNSAVEFQMYDAAPAAPPVPLPYFVMPDGNTASSENAVSLYLARKGAPGMVAGEAVQSEEVEAILDMLPAVAKASKATTKAKDEEVCAAIACTLQGPAAQAMQWLLSSCAARALLVCRDVHRHLHTLCRTALHCTAVHRTALHRTAPQRPVLSLCNVLCSDYGAQIASSSMFARFKIRILLMRLNSLQA